MLADGSVASRIPAQDLERARSFYAEKLGLEPAEERPGGLRYRCRDGEFALFESSGASTESRRSLATIRARGAASARRGSATPRQPARDWPGYPLNQLRWRRGKGPMSSGLTVGLAGHDRGRHTRGRAARVDGLAAMLAVLLARGGGWE